jgi:hypothetical protein
MTVKLPQMNPSEMRVAVCREALRLAEKPVLEVGHFGFMQAQVNYQSAAGFEVRNEYVPADWETYDKELLRLLNSPEESELQQFLRRAEEPKRASDFEGEADHDTSKGKISACCVGAAVLGYASLFDNLPMSEVALTHHVADSHTRSAGSEGVIGVAREVFGRTTADAMEVAFETGNGYVKFEGGHQHGDECGGHTHDNESCYDGGHEHDSDCYHSCNCDSCEIDPNEPACGRETGEDADLVCDLDEGYQCGYAEGEEDGSERTEGTLTLSEYREARDFGQQYITPKERFAAIMNRVIARGGTFFGPEVQESSEAAIGGGGTVQNAEGPSQSAPPTQNRREPCADFD